MMKRIFALALLGFTVVVSCSRAPMHGVASASAPVTNAPPIHLQDSIAEAKTANKLVLMDFNGTDWCPPCIEMHHQIFSQPEFAAYAQSNLVFLSVDFPEKYRLPPDASATNDLLSAQFNIDGFPTLIALNGDGREVWRHEGSLDGGLKELQTELAAARAKAK